MQLSTRRQVALKLLSAGVFASEQSRVRFEREIELASRLEHPHIARVYDSGLAQGGSYYAMELVDGEPLDRFVAKRRLPLRIILDLMRTVCLAVQYAHQRGIIHRDLKPTNILMDVQEQPHLLDFGLAKTFGELATPATAGTSIAGEIAGTPAYMSPEQAAGRSDDLDTRTDVYSLGAILYCLVVGRNPHDLSGTCLEVLRRVSEEEVCRPRSFRPDIDSDLEALLLKALAHDREARYSSAGALAEDLASYLRGDPISARSPSTLYFLRKRLHKHRAALGVSAVVVMVLAGMAILSYVRISRARDAAIIAQGKATDSARQALASRREAEVRLADSLLANGDASGLAGDWGNALDQYGQARELLARLELNSIRVDFGDF